MKDIRCSATSDGRVVIELEIVSEQPCTVSQNIILDGDSARMFRDRLDKALGVFEPEPDWKDGSEWSEVEFDDARDGDYAEFHGTLNGKHVVGRLRGSGDGYLSISPDDIVVGDDNGLPCVVVRNSDGKRPLGMDNLHIWRKLDPHRFDEPKDKGYYITQSGIILYNDGSDEVNWRTPNGEDSLVWLDWSDVLGSFADSEFPLLRITPEDLMRAARGCA